MATTAGTESLAEKALRETRLFMGKDASLVQHLPTGKIREAPFEDKKRERPTSLPVRILFGLILDGDRKGSEVWVLLIKARTEGQSPEQRFNVFDRHGNLVSSITADDAIRSTNPTNAFKWLRKAGTMDMTHLRAVIKYYFMVKKVDPMLPWPVDARFARELAAACKVARDFDAREILVKQKIKEREAGAEDVYQRRPSITSQQPVRIMTPVDGLRADITTTMGPGADAITKPVSRQRANTTMASTGKPIAETPKTPVGAPVAEMATTQTNALRANTTVPFDKTQTVPQRPAVRRRSASTQPTRSLPPEDSTSLFIPEDPRRAVTPNGFRTPSSVTDPRSFPQARMAPIDEFKRAFQMKMLPRPASTPTSRTPPPTGPKPSQDTFSIHQDTSRTDNPTAPRTPKPVSPEDNTTNSPLQARSSNSPPSRTSFISAYRKADAQSAEYSTQLRDTATKISDIKSQICALESALRELQVQEQQLKRKHQDAMLSKKRLHDELTPEKRELLRFGAELAEREFKRLKKRDANECVDGEEDWSFVMDLSMD